MSIFQIDLSLEIAILVFLVIFGIGLVAVLTVLMIKFNPCKPKGENDPESGDGSRKVNGSRVREVSVIQVESRSKRLTKNPIPIEPVPSTYVHCPSPTYEPTYDTGTSNDAFHMEEDFISVIVTF